MPVISYQSVPFFLVYLQIERRSWNGISFYIYWLYLLLAKRRSRVELNGILEFGSKQHNLHKPIKRIKRYDVLRRIYKEEHFVQNKILHVWYTGLDCTTENFCMSSPMYEKALNICCVIAKLILFQTTNFLLYLRLVK